MPLPVFFISLAASRPIARRTSALGNLGHQKDRLETDGHGLQLAKPAAFAGNVPAAAGRALDPGRTDTESTNRTPPSS
jgi:hypothetical protein